MNSLRTRIAALLIAAIVTVVGLATWGASRALQPPAPETTIEPVARQIQLLSTLTLRDPVAVQEAGATLAPAPAGGPEDARFTRAMARALEETGAARRAIVTQRDGATARTASVDLGEAGWLILDMPDFSPPADRWRILALWIAMIVLGSAAVSITAAWRLTRPLQLLENAAGRIGADGVLEHIPETGSAEVRAAARALNRLSDQLGRAMESRMRLVASAGHDLRTPMTRMRLRAEFIADEAERVKWLADLEELDAIADSAIRLVREEASRDGVGPLRLDRLLREVAEELRALRHGVEIGDLEAVEVVAGPLALRRALRNLIVNAATHGGGARVELCRRGGHAEIAISDEGPGIPEEMIDRIFEPFFRVDPARRKIFPGAGLGLAIAREIIERLGGRIEIANTKPRGLRQICKIPLAQPA